MVQRSVAGLPRSPGRYVYAFVNKTVGDTSLPSRHQWVDAARNPGILSFMAHLVSRARPDVVLCRDLAAGPAMLFDLRTDATAELSEDATAVIENDCKLQQAALERARTEGVEAAATEVELVVRLHLDSQPSERWEAERAVLEVLSQIVVWAWFEEQGGPLQ